MDFREWKKYKLREFVEVQNGYAFKSDDFTDKGIPVIKIKNIVSPRIQLEDAQYFNGEINLKLKQFLIKKGDTLISMTGSHINQIASAVGKIGRYQFDYPAMINQRVGKIYVTNEAIGNEDFLYYFLNQFETQFELAASAGGSANQANISPTQIKNLEILLPDIETQTRIAAILTSIDDKIELNCQTNATLEALAQTLFKEMCLPKNGENTEGWCEVKLEEVIRIKHGYAFKGEFFSDSETNDILITPGNFRIGGGFNSVKFKYYNGDFPKEYILKENDLIVTMTDLSKEGDTLGYSALVPTIIGKRLLHNQRIGKVEFNGNDLMKFFLYFTMRENNYRNFVLGSATGTTVRHTSPNRICDFTITLPDNKTLMAFTKIIKPLLDKIVSFNQETQTLTTLRDSLLPKLMKGEIAV
jgi:type I restriction enzyme S subunit